MITTDFYDQLIAHLMLRPLPGAMITTTLRAVQDVTGMLRPLIGR